MKALVYKGIGLLEIMEVPTPEISEGGILVRVMAGSICGTDLRILASGHKKIPHGTTRILGHEFSGIVEAIGREVKGFNPEERVAIAPNIGCGNCNECVQGKANLCPSYEAFGISLDGAFAEWVSIPAKAVLQGNVIKLPETVSFEEASLIEPLSCVLNGLETSQIRFGDVLLIFGAGPIGLMHLMVGRVSGTSKIMVADVVEKRLRLAKEMGADVVLHAMAKDFRERVFQETDGKGPDVISTACPIPEVQEMAFELAAIGGRINFFGGLPQGNETIHCPSNLIHYRNLRVTGVTGGSNIQFRRALSLIASKRVDIRRLISHSFEIQKGLEAFNLVKSSEGLKVILHPNL